MSDPDLVYELDQFEKTIEAIKKIEAGGKNETILDPTKYLIAGHETYFERTQELAELELKGAINNVIHDNVEINKHNMWNFVSLINSLKIVITKISNLENRISSIETDEDETDEDETEKEDYGARISTLEMELRLLKLNLKGGKGKTKKIKNRVMSNNLTK
jgi:hypothetical protein